MCDLAAVIPALDDIIPICEFEHKNCRNNNANAAPKHWPNTTARHLPGTTTASTNTQDAQEKAPSLKDMLYLVSSVS